MRQLQKSVKHNGGIAIGPSHEENGIPGIIKHTGQPIEFEGEEVIIKAESAALPGACEKLSEINQAGGGDPIPCDTSTVEGHMKEYSIEQEFQENANSKLSEKMINPDLKHFQSQGRLPRDPVQTIIINITPGQGFTQQTVEEFDNGGRVSYDSTDEQAQAAARIAAHFGARQDAFYNWAKGKIDLVAAEKILMAPENRKTVRNDFLDNEHYDTLQLIKEQSVEKFENGGSVGGVLKVGDNGMYKGDHVRVSQTGYNNSPTVVLLDVLDENENKTGELKVHDWQLQKEWSQFPRPMPYEEAIKIPKGGAQKMNEFHLQAQAAQIIASNTGAREISVYNWANKHGVNLTEIGHILSKPENGSALIDDMLSDNFNKVKTLLSEKGNPSETSSENEIEALNSALKYATSADKKKIKEAIESLKISLKYL